jgi:hypothetical protein
MIIKPVGIDLDEGSFVLEIMKAPERCCANIEETADGDRLKLTVYPHPGQEDLKIFYSPSFSELMKKSGELERFVRVVMNAAKENHFHYFPSDNTRRLLDE